MHRKLPAVLVAGYVIYKTWHNQVEPHTPDEEVEWPERLTRHEVHVTSSALTALTSSFGPLKAL